MQPTSLPDELVRPFIHFDVSARREDYSLTNWSRMMRRNAESLLDRAFGLVVEGLKG
jgi:hypothetical protein